jgi:ATP-dependent protease ClpP protease subunit
VAGYVTSHWRGNLSLPRSYWVNVVLLTTAFGVGSKFLDRPVSNLPPEEAAVIGLSLVALAVPITVWQFVGVWRSATNTSINTGRRFWPAVAKSATMLGVLVATGTTITTTNDLIKLLSSLQDPALLEYAVERIRETDLVFTGAINEKSTKEIISALEDRSIKILRVNSHGGLIAPAIRLARHIRSNNVMVMGEGECISACVMLLAASPYAAVYPGTKVTFHRVEPVVEFTNPQLRAENAIYLAEAEDVYREFGVAEWAIETARRQQFWTPTVYQQIEMGLIVYIYDPDEESFLFANEYCTYDAGRCS